MNIRTFRVAVIGIVLLSTMTETQAGAILYGATESSDNTPLSSLVVLDPTTGNTVSTIGAIGFIVVGLAVHPATGVLFGTNGVIISPS